MGFSQPGTFSPVLPESVVDTGELTEQLFRRQLDGAVVVVH
jgi:hypothetical protein